jgi:hypothetical protein
VDHYRFDSLTRWLGTGSPRRGLLRGLVGAGLGLGMVTVRWPETGEARKKRKRKDRKPKLKRNAFGCVDVGGKCQGNDANCCSGICQGKKPKKGRKDTSICVAHDNAGICFADSDTCSAGGNISCSVESVCFCVLTTGSAGFCGDFTAGAPELCRDCTTDTDCQEEFGPGAACVLLGGICSSFCPATGRTACVPPCPEIAL